MRAALMTLALGAAAASCNTGNPASSNDSDLGLRVELIGWGNARDPDGFAVTIGSQVFNIPWNGTVSVEPESNAALTITLDGIGAHCQADQTSRTHTPSGGADTVRFAIGCFGDFAFNEELPNLDQRMRYMDVLGQVRPLAEAPGWQAIREWSPDGRRLLYTTNERNPGATSMEIDVAQVDVATGTRVWVATSAAEDWASHWSPDGTRIAFNRWFVRSTGSVDSVLVYLVNADGSGEHSLLSSPAFDIHPDWLKDGSAIVFGCSRFYYLGGICRATPTGAELTAIVPAHWGAQDVQVSPQGGWIAYYGDGQGFRSIYTVPVTGGLPIRLGPQLPTYHPRWSPDGNRLAIGTVEAPDVYGIRTVERNGANLSPNLVAFSSNVGMWTWSSDGQWLIVSAVMGTAQHLYVLRSDGSGRRQVTFGPLKAFNVHWRPTSVFVPPPAWVTFAGAVSAPAVPALLQYQDRQGECVGMAGRVVGRIPCEQLESGRGLPQ